MISLTCTSCKKVLEIDDAFAGGVCRCQHCGTIQTVPSSLKRNVRPGAPGVGAKTLYQRNASGAVATAPAKSAASSPASPPTKTRAAAPESTAPKPSRWSRLAIALAAFATLIIIVALIAVRHLHF